MSSKAEFRDPPQEWLPFCKSCGRETAVAWTPLLERECECGVTGSYEWRLRYPPASSDLNSEGL